MQNPKKDIHFFMKEEILKLQKEKGSICISIVMPTHRLAPERDGDQAKLEKAEANIKTILNLYYSKEEITPLLANLVDLVAAIDFKRIKEGLGLYLSPNIKRAIQFYFPVKEQVVVRDFFEIRDLLFLSHFSREYYVLVVSEKYARLFKGIIDELEEIDDLNFPRKHEELYEYSKPSRGLSFTGHANLKEFEKDKSISEQDRMHGFLQEADRLMKYYLTEKTPLFLMGVEKNISLFKHVTRHQQNIMDAMPGNYDSSSDYELANLVWPKVKSYLAAEKLSFLKELEKKIGQRVAVEGIQKVWQAANEGRGHKLLVEKYYSQTAYLGVHNNCLYLEPPAAPHRDIPDAVESIIEMVLVKNGEVIMMENDMLKPHEHIALITRY